MSLPSSMADFVPCGRLLQKAYYIIYGLCINDVEWQSGRKGPPETYRPNLTPAPTNKPCTTEIIRNSNFASQLRLFQLTNLELLWFFQAL